MQDSFVLETEAGEGGEVVRTPDLPRYAFGTVVGLRAIPLDGYTVKGWEGDVPADVDADRDSITITILGAMRLVGSFSIRYHELVVTSTPGGAVQGRPDHPRLPHGTVVTLEARPSLGFRFEGWMGDAAGLENPMTIAMTGPRHITAVFGTDTLARPRILAVRDVRGDAGRSVVVTWRASSYESSPEISPATRVDTYLLWRSVAAEVARSAIRWHQGEWNAERVPRKSEKRVFRVVAEPRIGDTFWEYVVTIAADGRAVYESVAPTVADSGALGVPWARFMVQARAGDNQIWLDSDPDSGYSVADPTPVLEAGATPIGAPSLELVVWPNPARGHVELRFDADEPSGVAAELLDLQGRRFAHLRLAAGASTGRIEFPAGLAPGIYRIRLSTRSGVVSRPIVVYP